MGTTPQHAAHTTRVIDTTHKQVWLEHSGLDMHKLCRAAHRPFTRWLMSLNSAPATPEHDDSDTLPVCGLVAVFLSLVGDTQQCVFPRPRARYCDVPWSLTLSV